jgi:hemerythrin-like domain-containing protein
MKRHESLRPLSEHHHHVLVLSLEIRRAAESPAPNRDQKLRELANSVLRFWDQRGQTHFAEEEQVLLPEYARHIRLDEDPEVMRMLADHAAIRARIEDIRECHSDSFAPESIIELGRMLHDHVRLEEDSVSPRLEKALAERELNSVGSHLTRLHAKK